MIEKAKHWVRQFYQVPWCVPQWGWAEAVATARHLATGHVNSGSDAQRLEKAILEYLGLPYVLLVNRGRTAIELALLALGLKPGDEVVLPSYVCRSVLDAVLRVGCAPAFADVGRELNVSPETVQAALTPRTRAVIVPHLFGRAAPIDRIEAVLQTTGIALIDDAAQSLGAQCGGRLVGTFGACGIVSCGPGKALAGSGGGALVTRDRTLFQRARRAFLGPERATAVVRRVLGFWLWRRFRRFTLPLQALLERVHPGTRDGPGDLAADVSDLEAAIALEQLRTLESRVTVRRRNAMRLLEALGSLGRCSITDVSPGGVALKLVLVLPPAAPSVAALVERGAEAGVECQGGYRPCHHGVPEISARVPNTDRVWQRVLCIPLETPLRRPEALIRAMRLAVAGIIPETAPPCRVVTP